MPSLLKIVVITTGLLSFSIASAKTTHDIKDPKTVAIIDGERMPAVSAELMLGAINRGKQKLTMPEFLQGSIENKLLVNHVKKEGQLDNIVAENKVGFPIDIALEDQFINVIRLSYEEPLLEYIQKNFARGNLMAAATKPFKMTRKELKPLTVMKNRQALGFTDDQIEKSKTVELLRYKFPGQKTDQAITLWDIYRRQNVQGKDIIHKADIKYIKTQLQQRLGSLFVAYWMEQHSGLNQEEVRALKDLVYGKHFKKMYLANQGLVRVMHKDNPRLSEIAKTITQEEINAYYEANKEDFRQMDKARGRQIQTSSQDKIKQAQADLAKGLSFDEVAKKYSELKDKNGKVIIKTDWLDRESASNNWLRTLFFIEPIDKASRPYRSPQLNPSDPVYWQIIIVDERTESYQKPDSAGVRYVASQKVAEQKMTRQFKELRNSLFKQARIQLNPDFLKPKQKAK